MIKLLENQCIDRSSFPIKGEETKVGLNECSRESIRIHQETVQNNVLCGMLSMRMTFVRAVKRTV